MFITVVVVVAIRLHAAATAAFLDMLEVINLRIDSRNGTSSHGLSFALAAQQQQPRVAGNQAMF